MPDTFFYKFSTELKKHKVQVIYKIKCGHFILTIMRHLSFTFKKKNVFVEEEGNPSDKIVLVEEELDGMDIDGIAN